MIRPVALASLLLSLSAATALASMPPALSVSVSPASAAEGAKFKVTITRSGDLSAGSRISWTVAGAIDGADFGMSALPSGSAGFQPGQTTKVVTLTTTDDAVAEQDEAFEVVLSSPSNATIGVGAASGAIINNDGTSPPPPSRSPLTLINPSHSAYWAVEDAFINHVLVAGDGYDSWVKYGTLDPVTATFVRNSASGNLQIGVVRAGANVRASRSHYKGRWILDWQGDADFSLAGGVGTTVRVSPNRIEEYYDPSVHGHNPAKINMTRVGASGVTNIRFYRAEHEALLNAGEIFEPNWLADISRFDVFRPMDWTGVNDDYEIALADRPRANRPFYMRGRVPDWVIVRAAVDSGTQLWLNMPGLLGASPQLAQKLRDYSLSDETKIAASAAEFDAVMASSAPLDYLRSIVALLNAHNYPVDRPIYLELDNEVWNTVFFASTDFYAGLGRAIASRHSGQAGNARTGYGYRSAQFADLFAQALAEGGRAAQPWTMALAGQSVNVKRTTDALAAVKAFNGAQPMSRYGVAMTNYYSGGFFWHGENQLFGSKMPQAAWDQQWLAEFRADPAAFTTKIRNYLYSPIPMYQNVAMYKESARLHRQAAAAYGARFIGNYEGDSNEKLDSTLAADNAAQNFQKQWHETDDNARAILAIADDIRANDPGGIIASYIFCAAPRGPKSPWVECTPWDRTSGPDNAAWDTLLKPRQ
jgi:hypothetical protein